MKRVISWTSILAVLFSQTGCIGNNEDKNENYYQL